ncbi:NIPSNAP family protein [Notoacmeibacter sp. MSK16QG-6]|uniref:NIPSNAP family protein n=1 Tax=Notoacmeibacter sp. MSK16QG-6 TaxID=2957982 RepID=UPI0020A059A5|nr:NIPSNAP family protein [Notoacmeibacter sp. MSK16QG-6]MCP1198324.1 NIPSNAP family protein [Notoacmeibacter sp. MSK16QG-6]
MTYYEIATLKTVIFGAGKAAPGIERWLGEGAGTLLGAFATDIGPLNEVLLLRSFDSLDEMMAERERAIMADDPMGCMEHLVDLRFESYKPFDFIPAVEAGEFGPYYEFRTYDAKLNGIKTTQDLWRGAIPDRSEYSPLTVAMWGLDGAPRVTQIWPYKSLADREKARAQSVADGKWPAKGGPDWLTPTMTSAIAKPLPFSPLK